MTDLVAFLRARLDEDDRAGRISPRDDAGDPDVVAAWSGKSASNLYVQFYAHNNPARVLLEVEAKRRIVDEQVKVWPYEPKDYLSNPENVDAEITADHAEVVLRLLALPYSDHPNYDERWRL